MQRIPPRELRRQRRPQLFEGIELTERASRLGRVELLDACGEAEARQVGEERIVRRPGREKEPAPELAAPTVAEVRVQPVEERWSRPRLGLPEAEETNFGLLEQIVAKENLVRPFAGEDRLDPALACELRE